MDSWNPSGCFVLSQQHHVAQIDLFLAIRQLLFQTESIILIRIRYPLRLFFSRILHLLLCFALLI